MYFDKREHTSSILVAADIDSKVLPKVCAWIQKEYEKYFGTNFMVKKGIDELHLEAHFDELKS